nr:rhomboid family intramembrane serine protease [Lachnospiraceae bacterium]
MRRIRITFNSKVTLGFGIACVIAMLINIATGGLANQLFFMTYRSSLTNPLTYIRFFSHVLGHADWDHLIGNMAYILLLGPMLEEKYGSDMIEYIIFLTALITGLINFILFPGVALCGASGVVFAFILLTSFTSFRSGEIPLTFILVATIYIGQQIVQGLTLKDNISNM